MAKDAGVLDREATVTGRGGRPGRGGRGGRGTQGGQGGAGAPAGSDFSRLVEMLQRMRESLRLVVHIKPEVVPQELHAEFVRLWPQVDQQFNVVIADLTKIPSTQLQPHLVQVGLSGEMLKMKQTSMNYHLDRLDKAVRNYNSKPVLTAPLSEKKSWVESIVTWFKPACKTMNSVLGSLAKIIPGVEVVKEYKDHVEAAWDIAETATEDRAL